MSRYVDVDELIARLKKYNPQTSKVKVAQIVASNMPTISIVRCQDCKHWVYNFNGCSRNPCTEPWYATDFCNYGERESRK